MREVNLLNFYPRSKRPIAEREAGSPRQRAVARQFGREYFDGDRSQGYGGYYYDGRWVAVAIRMRDFYGLQAGDRVLDVGCAKGFLLHDFKLVAPGIEAFGVDISQYAIAHAVPDVQPYLAIATAARLPFPDRSFDAVIAINTIHNLGRAQCVEAVREIQRVSCRFSYIQVDSWLNDEQKRSFERWQLTPLTYFEPEGWRRLFEEAGYTGDYYWTITE